jgi:hypothetical protein
MADLVSFLAEFLVFIVQITFFTLVINFVINLIQALFEYRKKDEREIEERIVERLNQIVHRVKIEKHNDVFYWFDHDSDEFLVQGKTVEEIVAALKLRFIDHVFVVEDKFIVAGPEFKYVPANEENFVALAKVIK